VFCLLLPYYWKKDSPAQDRHHCRAKSCRDRFSVSASVASVSFHGVQCGVLVSQGWASCERTSTVRVHDGKRRALDSDYHRIARIVRADSLTTASRDIAWPHCINCEPQRESLLSRGVRERERERERGLWAFVISAACANARGSEISLSVTALNY